MKSKKTFPKTINNMKNSLKIVIAIIISFYTFSCSNDEAELDFQSNNLEKIVNLKKSTTIVSPLILNLGATEINVIKTNLGVKYQAISKKQFKFNGKLNSISNFSVILKDGFLVLENDERYKISLTDNIAYIVTPDFSGKINESTKIESLKNINTFILLIYLNEVLVDDSIKTDFETANKASCSFWNTYYSVGVGLSSAAAQADLEYEVQDAINSGDANGCTQIGGAEAAPFSGGTVWLQAWCC